jgi:hypothetical protein
LNVLTSFRSRLSPGRSIYFHSPCFDGIISCVLAWDFLETEQRWSVRRLFPVDYDARPNWLASDINESCAVLDFLYHPSAGFWADHHPTTFLSATAEADYRNKKHHYPSTLLYNPQCSSTAALIWNRFREFFQSRTRLRDLMLWADKIDSARYDSVEEAIFGDAPALRINFSLMLGNSEYCEFLVRQLREQDFKTVSELPEVAQRFDETRKRISRGIEELRSRIGLLADGIVAFDVCTSDDAILSRYAPYYLYPNARYSIGLSRSRDAVRITAMRNPWLQFESIPLGELFERFGGGGHQRVASVFLSGERAHSAEQVADEILFEMRRKDKQPRLREVVFA